MKKRIAFKCILSAVIWGLAILSIVWVADTLQTEHYQLKELRQLVEEIRSTSAQGDPFLMHMEEVLVDTEDAFRTSIVRHSIYLTTIWVATMTLTTPIAKHLLSKERLEERKRKREERRKNKLMKLKAELESLE